MSAMQSLQACWATLAPARAPLGSWAALLVTLVVVWWLAIAPAWARSARAPAQHQTLDAITGTHASPAFRPVEQTTAPER